MVEKKEEKKMGKEDRFRYIGFDVYPEKPRKFWKDEGEEKKYLEEVKKRKPGLSSMERDYSLISASVFSAVDRMVIMISSILMIVAFFLPWFSLSVKDEVLRYNPFIYIGKLSLVLSYSAFGGPLVVFFALVVLLLMFTSLGYAILSLVTVVKIKGEGKEYHNKLKKTLRLGFLPLGLWLILVIISMIGMKTPFLSGSGIKPLGENFNVITFLTISSYGLWLTLCCLIVNSFKTNDL